MSIYRVKTSELRRLVDPLDGVMWKCRPIQEAEIRAAIAKGDLEHRSWSNDGVVHLIRDEEEARAFHVRRIATLINEDFAGKIFLALENHTSVVRASIFDGNHRVAAAYVRGDHEIELVIGASQPDRVLLVLPSATESVA